MNTSGRSHPAVKERRQQCPFVRQLVGKSEFERLNATIRMTIAGGFQAPGHGATSSLYGLLTEPEQLRAVAVDLALVPNAVHEGLRWLAPFG